MFVIVFLNWDEMKPKGSCSITTAEQIKVLGFLSLKTYFKRLHSGHTYRYYSAGSASDIHVLPLEMQHTRQNKKKAFHVGVKLIIKWGECCYYFDWFVWTAGTLYTFLFLLSDHLSFTPKSVSPQQWGACTSSCYCVRRKSSNRRFIYRS